MNREFKFRVWDNKKYIGEYTPKDLLQNFPSPHKCGYIDDLIFQQYTGLKDKNGKEIYEGDLINFTIKGIVHGPESEKIEKAEVFYDEINCCFSFGKYKTNDLIDYSFCFADRIDRKSIEIVGNIFV